MTEEERKDYLKYIENYTINDLSDIFNTQNFVIQDKDKFNEILLYYHFKQNEEIEQLQQENKELKEHIEKYEHYCKTTGIEELMKENKKYKEVIDKIKEYITIYRSYEDINGKDYLKGRDEIGTLSLSQVDKLLDILKEVE